MLRAVFQQYGVDMAFQVIDGDERLAERPGKGLGVGHADQQSPGKPWAFGHGDGVEIGEVEAGLLHRFSDDRCDIAQVLAGGELGHHATPSGMDVELRRDHA